MKRLFTLLGLCFVMLISITYSNAQTMRKSGSDVQIYDGSQWRSMNNATLGACSSAGQLRYNSGAARLEFCNGSNWLSMDSGVNAGSCSGTPAGTVRYSGGVTQFCNGSNWRNGFVNALCGSAESGASTSAPSSNLCNPGSASAVSTNATTFTWSCTGSAGGDNDSCSKPRRINGSCSGSHYNCTAGSSNIGAYTDTGAQWRWRCDGINGGTNSGMCTQNKPVNGVCNNGTRNGCTTGSANDAAISDTSTLWRWRCDGSSGGSNSGTCSIARPGACNNSTRNGCSTGTANDGAISDTSTQYRWRCDGNPNSGTCAITRPGVCGSAASGSAVSSQPTSNQCSYGTYVDLSDTGSYWQWRCNGNPNSGTCQRARAAETRCWSHPTESTCLLNGTCTGTGSSSTKCGSPLVTTTVYCQPTSNGNCVSSSGGGGGGGSCSSRVLGTGAKKCILPGSTPNGATVNGTCVGGGNCYGTCNNGNWSGTHNGCENF